MDDVITTSTPVALETARLAYGRGTAVWAHLEHEVNATWWVALSGTRHTDVNQVLLCGEDAREALPGVLERVEATGKPSLLMLAGAGLSAAQDLADDSWVCVGALPFMYREARPGSEDARVRALTGDDLPAARQILSATFSTPPDAAGALYSPGLVERGDARAWGLFDPELVSVAITAEVGEGLYVGWALATPPTRQRRGYGSSLLRHIDEWYFRHGAMASLHLASSAGARMYAEREHLTLEHWQVWSRPRWLLG